MRVWAEMLQAAVRMGVAPEAFWQLSLREWRMLTTGVAQAGPLGRAAFEQLAGQWPDTDAARSAGESE
jgi:uncharacterized phage protein (TIGR02216 family)